MAAAQQYSQRVTPAAREEPAITGPGVPAPVIDLAIPNHEMPALTAREQDVLLCWLTSDSKTAASTALGLSSATVKTHLQRIRAKYEAAGRNAPTKSALLARALQDGLIRLEDL